MDEECAAMKYVRGWALLVCVLGMLPGSARAHVGSKDVFEETSAGPYKLFVTIRPPVVIPGVAGVEVRTSGAEVRSITVAPLTLTGVGSEHPPVPDAMKRSGVDPKFYTASVWMMQAGSMQVHFDVDGASGKYAAAVPVAAIAIKTLKMQRAFGWSLGIAGIILIVGMGGIAGAAVREGNLQPGAAPTTALRRRGLVVSGVTIAICLGMVWGGDKWWNVEAANFADTVYRPLSVTDRVEGDHLRMLVGAHDSARLDQVRSNGDFILDHGQPMHLYVVREPELDAVYHLHPKFTRAGEFDLDLPMMPAGTYRLYGDVVHANGFPETLVSTLDLPGGVKGVALGELDAEGHPAPLSAGELGSSYKLPDGYTMVWERPAALTANTAYAFHFELLGPDGKAATGMRTYLGMAGHAAFLKTDGTVFAHVHPAGSAAMAAMMLANNEGSMAAASDSGGLGGMAGMGAADVALSSNAVEFPYGFPSAGRYRVFVQMKHDSVVETGVFDAVVK
jgi:hypothetical protein